MAWPFSMPALALASPPPISHLVIQTQNQTSLVVSDAPGPLGGILLKTATGAMISVSETGITISNGQGFPPDRLVPLAQELGLDRQAFQACLDSGRPAVRVGEDIAEGEHVGVSATPTNILLHNKTGAVRVIVGAVPLTEVRAGVAQLLAESGQPPSVAVPGETWLPR